MYAHRLAVLVAGAACALFTAAASTGQCDVVNKAAKAEAVIKVAGKRETLGAGGWMPIADCTGLEVEKGTVQVHGVVGGVPQKALCEEDRPCALPPASKSLVISPTSSYALAPGGHRMDRDVVRKFRTPKGEVYGIDAAAKFDFSQLSGTATSFALIEGRNKIPIFEAKVSGHAVIIPAEHLKRGTKYSWQVHGPGGRSQKLASGGFDIMSEEDAASITKKLAALEQSGERTDAEKILDELAIFLTHDLTYEIEMLRDTLRGKQ